MASKLAHIARRRGPSSALRLLGSASASSTQTKPPIDHRTVLNFGLRSSSTARSIDGAVDDPSSSPSLRRRRRGGGGKASSAAAADDRTSGEAITAATTTTTTNAAGGGAAFAPVDASTGEPLDAPSYLALASLSPWVPCPDMVVKRVFEIVEASPADVHADLGCGDGRLNFAAVGVPYGVRSSWGVDVDSNILEKCRERLGKRFVPSFGVDAGGSGGDDAASEAERLEFLQADLLSVMKRQKEKYQQNQRSLSSPLSTASIAGKDGDDPSSRDESKDDEITRKISQSTVVTMYFVDDALKQLQPYLASVLGGKDDVRVVTIGYEMKGWDATWVERVLGLTIFKYDMKNVSQDPPEWTAGEGGKSEEEEGEGTTRGDFYPGEYDDPEEAVAEELRRKRERDTKELDEGLRIHHDEALDDLAQFRQPPSLPADAFEEWEREEDGWDFDEEEDPEALMEEARRRMAAARTAGRGKGLMAGLGDAKKKGCDKGDAGAKKKPVWKKP